MPLKPAPTARPIARQGLNGLKTSPRKMLRNGNPSQAVTKAKVTEKLRPGSSWDPCSPDQIVKPSRNTANSPASSSATGPSRTAERPGGPQGRQAFSSKRAFLQPDERAKKE